MMHTAITTKTQHLEFKTGHDQSHDHCLKFWNG